MIYLKQAIGPIFFTILRTCCLHLKLANPDCSGKTWPSQFSTYANLSKYKLHFTIIIEMHIYNTQIKVPMRELRFWADPCPRETGYAGFGHRKSSWIKVVF